MRFMAPTRTVVALLLAALLPLAHAAPKTSATLAMTLEPVGLDPTAAAASSISEVVLYNVFETLTKIRSDGSVGPLLAQSWTVTPDAKTWSFRLQGGVKFHNGAAFDAESVKFSLERAAATGSLNKDRAVFGNIVHIRATDPLTVVLTLKNPDPDLLFKLGQGTAILVEPKSAATNATQPVGTGPYTLERWNRGASLSLVRFEGHRDAKRVALQRVNFRFISEAAAQVAALLAGDVDAFPRVSAARSLKQFEGNPKFQVLVGGSRTKVILAMNHARKPLDDVRVRRAIAKAIDRQAVIDGAADGFGVPIGSYYVKGMPGFVDLTAVNSFDVPGAQALLKEASQSPGFALPLSLTIKLPPTPYARAGGEIVAAQLAKVGITAKLENIEWAQWLSGVYGQKAYDLTLIAHVEPLDFGNFARPNYYWNYSSPKFNELWARIGSSADMKQRAELLGQAQRLVADEAVAAYLYQPSFITVADARLQGLWKDMPILANELSALRWK
jgi:peptide/nickel transport system substrate-binding protein